MERVGAKAASGYAPTAAPGRDRARSVRVAEPLATEIVDDVRALERLAPAWDELVLAGAPTHVTLSPLWLLTWWRVFGPDDGRALRAVVVRSGGALVGVAPLLVRVHRYHRVLPFRRVELCGSGERVEDEICSDYLGVVAARGSELAVARAVTEALATERLGRWHEVVLTRMEGSSTMSLALERCLAAAAPGAQVVQQQVGVCHFARLGPTWDDHLAALPSESRYFLRRSQRDFDAWAKGRAEVHVAHDARTLEQGLAVLEDLHERRWRAAGRASLFQSQRFRSFHVEVTSALLARGALDLSWLTVAGQPIAALYNVAYGGRVHYYQAGRVPNLPKGVRAGVVLHAAAMKRALAAGLEEYDFLAGSSQLKRRLGPEVRSLVELRVCKPGAREATRRLLARARALAGHMLGRGARQDEERRQEEEAGT